MGGATRFARAAFTSDGAKKWNRFRLWLEVGDRGLEFLGSGPHERMMERMIDTHEAREDALRFQFGKHCLQRNPGASQGQRARTVDRCDRDRAVVPRNQ